MGPYERTTQVDADSSSRQRPWRSARGWGRSRLALFLVGLVLMLASCTAGASTCPPPETIHDDIYDIVSFASSVPYEHAVRLLTDLYLQPEIPCGHGVTWQPQGQRDTYARLHKLFVQVLARFSNWEARLRADPSVVGIDYRDTIGYFGSDAQGRPRCGAINPLATPQPGAPVTPTRPQTGTFARITFAAPLDTYETALAAMVNLGLILGDYCAWHAPSSPTSCFMPAFFGQEATFASTSALTVTPWPQISSDQWQQQLQATPGVAGVQTPYAPPCPSTPTPS